MWSLDQLLRLLILKIKVCGKDLGSDLNRGFFVYVLYSTLLRLTLLRFFCVGGSWDRAQDCVPLALAVRRSNHSARSHHQARSHPPWLNLILRLDRIQHG